MNFAPRARGGQAYECCPNAVRISDVCHSYVFRIPFAYLSHTFRCVSTSNASLPVDAFGFSLKYCGKKHRVAFQQRFVITLIELTLRVILKKICLSIGR